MRGQKQLFGRGRDDWETAQRYFERLHREFKFAVDCAANDRNAKLPLWLGPDSSIATNALAYNGIRFCGKWGFLNPPYSLKEAFVRWAWEQVVERQHFAGMALVLPSRTDTAWFHEYIWDEAVGRPLPWAEPRFLRGRQRFELDGKPQLDKHGRPTGAPFPTVTVIFRPV